MDPLAWGFDTRLTLVVCAEILGEPGDEAYQANLRCRSCLKLDLECIIKIDHDRLYGLLLLRHCAF